MQEIRKKQHSVPHHDVYFSNLCPFLGKYCIALHLHAFKRIKMKVLEVKNQSSSELLTTRGHALCDEGSQEDLNFVLRGHN